ncbi:hypothetical protein [Pseudarthrobacter sp. S6]|uniref:hypothetical protein n=1 Tax=Pseudarthrobacter sp. S6 TaxID=3418420 RepID=UPI003CEB3EB3
MSYKTTGHTSVSVIAGHIRATSQPIHPEIGKQVSMGDNLYISITPAIAQQWIGVLETITAEEK